VINNSLVKKDFSNVRSHFLVVQFHIVLSQIFCRLLEEGVLIYIFDAMQGFVGLNNILSVFLVLTKITC